MNCCFPKTHHCEWWNINTHRCNHLGRAPVRCERYGLGRAQIGDWGRVGSVNIIQRNGAVETIPQVSNDLVASLHPSNVPAPLLPPHYLMSNRPTCCSSARTTESIKEDHFDAYIGRDFGVADLLNDPVMKEQASAAYLCGKLHGMLRRNATFHSLERKSFGAVRASDCLKEICSLASEGLTAQTEEQQHTIINSIRSLVYPQPPVSEETCSAPARKRRKSKHIPPSLPSSVARLFASSPKTNDLGADDTRLLAAFDPFLMHLACRPVNWNYVGKGLLCSPRQTFLGQSLPVTSGDSYRSSKLLLWSPPISPCSNCPPSLHMTKLARHMGKRYQTDHHRLPFPSSLALGCNLVELEAFLDTENGLNVVTRWDGSQANAAQFHLTVDELQPSGYVIDDFFQPSLSSPATSVCASPWIPGQWAVAGTHSDSGKDGRFAFINLYSSNCSTTDGSSWRGRLPFDSFEETFTRDCNSVISASTGASDLDDAIQMEMKEYLRACPSLLHTTGQPNFTPFGTRCSVNFSGYPGELYLTTSRRILTFDTRQNSSAHELFSMNSHRWSNGGEKRFALFNEADQLTLSCPRLIGDVYVLLGSLHNFLLLDRRMPGRSVLQWSHGLLSAPCYSDWTAWPSSLESSVSPPSPSSLDREDKESRHPQVLLCAGSQFPPFNLNLVGLNVTSQDSGPQLIGPSISAPSLRRLLGRIGSSDLENSIRDQSNNNFSVGVMDSELVSQRIEASLCGLVMLEPSNSKDLSAVSLTSAGDLFFHSWHRSTERARHVDQRNSRCSVEWMYELRTNSSKSMDKAEHSGRPSLTTSVDLDEVGRLSDEDDCNVKEEPSSSLAVSGGHGPTCWWAMSEIASSSDWSDVVKASSKHLFADLCTNWQQAGMSYPDSSVFRSKLDEARQKEETHKEKQLDELSLAVTIRLRRLKQLLHDVLPSNLPTATDIAESTSSVTTNHKRHTKRKRKEVNKCDD